MLNWHCGILIIAFWRDWHNEHSLHILNDPRDEKTAHHYCSKWEEHRIAGALVDKVCKICGQVFQGLWLSKGEYTLCLDEVLVH